MWKMRGSLSKECFELQEMKMKFPKSIDLQKRYVIRKGEATPFLKKLLWRYVRLNITFGT